MKEMIPHLPSWIPYLLFLLPVAFCIVFYRLVIRIGGVVIIPEDSIGIVNKKFVLWGTNKNLPDGKIIALNGEAGWQADALAPGVHYRKWPWQYEIKIEKMFVVPAGNIATVYARDGVAIEGGRVLGRKVNCDTFQDARKFLVNGGERGQQIAFIPQGTYRINTALFEVKTEKVYEVPSGKVGVITTKDGKELPKDEIAGEKVDGHDSYQNGQAFMDNGGWKGRQAQVILAGRYFINPFFAEVELVDMTEVQIAHVGVVIQLYGKAGTDVSGDDFQHASLVGQGEKGVWRDPLDPGLYAINPCTHKVVQVPTQNIVLNWADDTFESHRYDEKLSSITVRSMDGFSFTLNVSQIIHISRNYASYVIAQFGSVESLVNNVLSPLIGNYFRNSAQNSNVISFLSERNQRQDQAKDKIQEVLTKHHVTSVDTLIGDINPPEELLEPLKQKQIAEQQKLTFAVQQEAQVERQKLEQSRAMAETQASVVSSERQVAIKKFGAEAVQEEAKGTAGAKTINAKADAEVLKVVGMAEAEKIKAVGGAEADVIKQKIDSMEAGNYALVLVAEHLAKAGVPLVPQITAGGSGGAEGGLVNVLLGTLLHDNLKKAAVTPAAAPQAAHLEAVAAAEPAAAPAASASEERNEPAAGESVEE
ncbi:MAG TPA: SPFH domain-containing protein [Patescibacteria group bacterium]